MTDAKENFNYAENDKRIMNNPELSDCYRMGSTHSAYGWSPSPWGHWTNEQKAEYDRGWHGKK